MGADDEAREVIGRLLGANQYLLRAVPDEIVRRLEQTLLVTDSRWDLTGTWRGIVNGREEQVQVRQKGPVVYLEGEARDDWGQIQHTFIGEGRLVSNVLVFTWSLQAANQAEQMGVNVMTLSADGNVLDGKYFTAVGGSGAERYERG